MTKSHRLMWRSKRTYKVFMYLDAFAHEHNLATNNPIGRWICDEWDHQIMGDDYWNEEK